MPAKGLISSRGALSMWVATDKSLYQLHDNGLVPDLSPVVFAMSPAAYPGARPTAAAEIMYREAGDLLYGVVDVD
jgi:hypothetical protein